MLTFLFNKTLRVAEKRQIIKFAPTVTNSEKIISVVARIVTYSSLIASDLTIVSLVPPIVGFFVMSVNMEMGLVCAAFGTYLSGAILVVGSTVIYPALFFWCYRAYVNKKLRMLQL